MKVSELRELNPEELQRRIDEMRSEAFKLRLRRATEQLPNPLRLRVLRRDIARCLTVLAVKTGRTTGSGNAQD
ncbi:MAG: 50S ribosomal protein L29 [bacterium]